MEDPGRFAAELCAWFDREGRDLPWRRRRTGYRTLVAESMLQQTQVTRVVDRYRAFLRRFPTVAALAAAPEQEVLAMWQGLGYYARARTLHAAARVIVAEYGGHVPRDGARLRRLPGVGRYTAAAIASIVYGAREALVDGNVLRVLSRLAADDGPRGDPRTLRRAWHRAAALVEAADRPGTLNEALMELGAVVCTPGRPRCGSCPVAAHCEALRQGRAASIPQARGAGPRRCVHHHAVVVRKGMLLLLERRPPRGMWAGMWQVPTVEAPRALPAAALRGALPVRVGAIRRLGSFRHLTTHRRVTFHVFAATSRAGRGDWFGASELADLPMGSAQRRVIRVALGIPEGVPVATGRRAPPNRTRSSKRSIRGSAVTAAGRPGGSCLHHAGSTTSLA